MENPVEIPDLGIALDRCPNALFRENPDALALFNFWSLFFQPRGLMPEAGGWLDQAHSFCCSVEFLERLHRMKQKQEADKASKEARRRARRK